MWKYFLGIVNIKINGIDGPGRARLFIHRAGPGRYFNAP